MELTPRNHLFTLFTRLTRLVIVSTLIPLLRLQSLFKQLWSKKGFYVYT